MLRWFRKWWAIRSYRSTLPRALVIRYGRAPSYTIEQVRETAKTFDLNERFMSYAYAAFCSEDDFVSHYNANGQVSDWLLMRGDIGEWHLGGSPEHDGLTHAAQDAGGGDGGQAGDGSGSIDGGSDGGDSGHGGDSGGDAPASQDGSGHDGGHGHGGHDGGGFDGGHGGHGGHDGGGGFDGGGFGGHHH